MTPEWLWVESRRDGTHRFSEGPDGFNCSECHKPRWAHVQDGFVPQNQPSRLSWHPKDRYRGGHPYWNRPGTIRVSKDEERQLERFVNRARAVAKTRASKISVDG